ncbi:MAG: HK97 family phage prohead protease [Alteripontixanthobacter sp.]
MKLAGYAALFDVPDASHDTIRRGAFIASLAQRRDPLPLYWQHRPEQRIGWIERAEEDARGLKVIARIDNPSGRAGRLLEQRSIDGLSFGFRARKYRTSPQGRELAEIELFEVSLVTHPLQHGARVHLVA